MVYINNSNKNDNLQSIFPEYPLSIVSTRIEDRQNSNLICQLRVNKAGGAWIFPRNWTLKDAQRLVREAKDLTTEQATKYLIDEDLERHIKQKQNKQTTTGSALMLSRFLLWLSQTLRGGAV